MPERKPALKVPEGIRKSLQEHGQFRKEEQAHTQEQAHAHEQAHIQAHAPKPKKTMQRAHFFLPAEQIAFLDKMAAKSGEGVTRSDWLRYAISKLIEDAEKGELDL